MSRKRKAIPLEQRLAAALVCLLEPSLRDAARSARLPAKSIIRMFTNHHLDFHALGGADKWWNLHPMTRAAHDARFGQDAAAIAKVKRLQRQFRPEVIGGMIALVEIPRQAQRKAGGAFSGAGAAKPKPTRKIASRPFPKRQRPMRWRHAPCP